MLSRDLLPLERAVYRAAREQLSSDNQAEQTGIDAEQRDRAAAAVIGPIIDDPALYRLMPERHSDQSGRIYDDAYQDVLRAVINDLYYFGPLEDLLYDESLSEIMVNAPDAVWIERDGRLWLTDVCFEDDDHVKFIIDRIAAGMNRRCDEASPLCDCTIVRPGTPFNGSRVNASLKGVAVDHNIITIRKFRKDALTPEALMANGSFDRRMLEIMRAIVEGRMSTIVAGGTGSGKTTLLNAISLYIPHEERIITIEDTPELRLNQPHVIRMETRDANVEGKGLTFVPISAATMQGVRELPGLVYNRLKDIPPVPVFTPEYKKPEPKANDRAFTIKRMEAHVWSVEAPWLEYILAGSNVDDYESLQYFQRQLGESGILDALVQKGVEENDTILIGEYQFDYIF